MSRELLFELGTEEIPAKMAKRVIEDLPAQVKARLAAARVDHGAVRVLGSPRRIAVLVDGVAEQQPDLRERVYGPPASAAFGPDGAPTKAAIGFAAKNGVEPGALTRGPQDGKKGDYAIADRFVPGRSTRELLPSLLVELVAGIAWPKSMRWGWGETAFVRPLQWIVALWGGDTVPLVYAGIPSGNRTRGHRFLANDWITIAAPGAYVDALRAAHVIVDPRERTAAVYKEIERASAEIGVHARPDDALVDEVAYLVELPVGVAGGFDPAYLEVPEEVIVTAMRTHQRYFALSTPDGRLAPSFVTIAGTRVKSPDVVRKGNETVLAARLSDARFFFTEDKKKSFAEWNARLDSVVFQAKLGEHARTVGHKIARITDVAGQLAAAAGADVVTVTTAAGVCKADLASGVVGEFPELQGVMGRHYARQFGMSDAIAAAIEQHYWPKGQGAALPASDAGALVALADRMDTILGCFAVGLEPTGSADPFGLRRAAIAIWLILLDRPAWSQLWTPLFAASRAALAAQGVTYSEKIALPEFFRARLRGIFIEQGIPAQDADAALAQEFRDPVDARARAAALGKLPREAREVFKRVANILDDARAKNIEIRGDVDPGRFVADGNIEHRLHAAIRAARERESIALAKHDYPAVFESLVQLQPTVAAFFDKGGVMVMDPVPELRDNRLALLASLIGPYASIADFRLLAGATS
jgi:glycyl-tRNA synthetase beta chain